MIGEDLKSIKVILKDRQVAKKIMLFDPSSERFTFEGEGQYKVLDKDENTLLEGSVKAEEDITIQEEVTTPFSVELKIDKTLYTFYGEKAEKEG